jgi:hypothetical protein
MSCISSSLRLLTYNASIANTITLCGLPNTQPILENQDIIKANGIIGVNLVDVTPTPMPPKLLVIFQAMIQTMFHNVDTTTTMNDVTNMETNPTTSSNETALTPTPTNLNPAIPLTNLDLSKPICKTLTSLRICYVIAQELMKRPSIYSN